MVARFRQKRGIVARVEAFEHFLQGFPVVRFKLWILELLVERHAIGGHERTIGWDGDVGYHPRALPVRHRDRITGARIRHEDVEVVVEAVR